MSVRWFLGIFWTISFVGNSVAATMEIVPARANDSALGNIITVYGDILPGDGLKFQNAAKDAGAKATVLFDSNGGSLAEGVWVSQLFDNPKTTVLNVSVTPPKLTPSA
jgi:hypothetical protein